MFDYYCASLHCEMRQMTLFETIRRLRDTHRLTAAGYETLLLCDDPVAEEVLRGQARAAALESFGRGIYVRGLVEIGNICRNDCFYCGIRASNSKVCRYTLTADEILGCCRRGYATGLRTFVLQGGENPAQFSGKSEMLPGGVAEQSAATGVEWLEDLVRRIKAECPECAVTLSLGEMSAAQYRALKAAGADRYLLRHETRNAEHYRFLHPAQMSQQRRLQCLSDLRAAGFQTGAGMMVGSPGQTIGNLVEDLLFLQEFRPEMIGTGPFVHHPDTPFAGCPDGSVELTLKLISILRLMDPHALIPATTALSTLAPDGRARGILAGANVVMPNLSPATVRGKYSLYEGKACTGAESAEGLDALRSELAAIGCEISPSRGDWRG